METACNSNRGRYDEYDPAFKLLRFTEPLFSFKLCKREHFFFGADVLQGTLMDVGCLNALLQVGRKCQSDVYHKITFNSCKLAAIFNLIANPAFDFASPCVYFFPGYELFAFISHMGASTMSGHYVCHIKKEGR